MRWFAVLIGAQVTIDLIIGSFNTYLEINTQTEIYKKVLDRLMRAPVNLFFDVTPVTRILAYFGSDLREINAGFFNQVQYLIRFNALLVIISGQTLWNLPALLPVFVYQVLAAGHYRGLMLKVRDNSRKVFKDVEEKVNSHCKISYAGRPVIHAFGYVPEQIQTLTKYHIRSAWQHRFNLGCEWRNGWNINTSSAVNKIAVMLLCIRCRNSVESLVLMIILSK